MSHSLMLVAVAFGGAFGAIARFEITNGLTQWLGHHFPYGTFTVNVVGSFFMGALMAALASGTLISPYWRPFVAVGFLGALTTFSTFSFDTLTLFTQGEWLKAGLNVLINVLCCLIAVAAGYQLLLKTP